MRPLAVSHFRSAAATLILPCLSIACRGELVTLGQRVNTNELSSVEPSDAGQEPGTTTAVTPFRAPRVVEPTVVPVIGSDAKDDNPTLTGDLLEIYFTSTRGGDSDVWFATRDSADVDFSTPVALDLVNTPEFESSPAVESDGLTLWVARREENEAGIGDLDIYVCRRPSRNAEWSSPELATALSSAGDDIPRPPGANGLVMPLASRAEGETYQLYLARRQTTRSEFEAPVLLQAAVREDYGSVDGFVTWDGDHLLFAYTQDDLGDLFVARNDDSAFTEPLPLVDINTAADERDPWVSSDGKLLFFASDRDGTLRIYHARLEWD